MYDITYVGDAVMLHGLVICFCMLVYNSASRVVLLFVTACDELLLPGGSDLRAVRRNMFGRGHFSLEEEKCVSLVNQGACLSSHLIYFVTVNIS